MLVSAAILAVILQTSGRLPDPLVAGFQNPPSSARPHTWWHWMDGNVTKEGITADLKAMKEVGIGGAQMFTVAQGIPKGPVDYMSPKWREMTVHAVKEAARFGIELCIHNCAGWSSSGGPWVKPEHAMQVVAWSTVQVTGPKTFSEPLPPIQAPQVFAKVDYSKDIAVYAFPTPSEGESDSELPLSQGEKESRPLFLGKTGVNRMDGLVPDLSPSPAGLAIPAAHLHNVTRHFVNGRLTWEVPQGNWTILRLGHVPTGKNNHPAPPESDGLEVDKMSREAMDAFWSGTMATVIKDIGPLAGKVLNNALIDSYEVGGQNWTPKFREEFRKRRGYDCLPWMPAVAGFAVESKEKTERFLWDFRRTIADLFADNYFGYFKELSRKHGIQFSVEPYGSGGFDNLQVGGLADIPMGEFWLGGGTQETLKLAASAAHTNGRAIVGAESFTADDVRGRWLENPYDAKALGDLVFTHGINRYIFHRYAHQPWMDKFPGMTMGPWGTHLERTQTWWTEAKAWMKYIARCQYLLQKGKFVADVLYYTGESAPVDLPSRMNLKPAMPAGYDYDGCDTTVLMKLQVKNGRLVLPDGMSYRILVLPQTTIMSLQVARKLRGLVASGAIVVGRKPTGVPSLHNFSEEEQDLKVIADEVWGKGPTLRPGWVYGKVATVSALPLIQLLKPDFEYKSLTGGAKLAYIHRRIGNAEVYFVSNQKYAPAEVDATFRVTGKRPELWHADSGLVENAPVYRPDGNRTVVPLRLGPAESVFVVFRRADSGDHLTSFKKVPARGEVVPMPPKVTIRSARYESADGRGADVTAIVQQLVKQGEVEIPATNGLFGDPVVNVVKRLVIEYAVDGKPMKKTVAENETLVLAESPKGPNEPGSYNLRAVASGSPMVAFWKKGTYESVNSRGTRFCAVVLKDAESVSISGPWKVNFKPNWGAPASINLAKLISWTEHPNSGVKYFSGSATYSKEFRAPAAMTAKDRVIVLDLGRVKNFATVRLNGKELAVLWKEPFSVDLTGKLKAGLNRLEVKVTNLWVNRIIGDEQLPPDVEWQGVTLKNWPEWLVKGQPRPKTGRYTFTTWKFWNKDSPLLESGLLGPVVIRSTVWEPVSVFRNR